MFAGYLRHYDPIPDPAALADQLLAAINPYATADRSGKVAGPNMVLVQTQLNTTERARLGSIPARCPGTGNAAVGWVRLKNRSELLRVLDVNEQGDGPSDLELVLAAYARWGSEAARQLRGEFAFGIWDAERREVYLARDPLGTRPLFVSRSSEAAVFATSLAAFRNLPGIQDAADPIWMACYIADLATGPQGPMALRDAVRVQAGHWAYLGATGLRTQRYFTLRDDAPWEDSPQPHWLVEYRNQLEAAGAFGADTDGLLGVETSGGLDSSTLVALAALTRPDGGRGVHGLGYAVFERETDLILATSAMWGVECNHIFTRWDNGPEGELERRMDIFDTVVGHPCQHGSVLGFTEVLSAAQTIGVRVLLSGFGGDEGVTSQGFEVLDELARRARWRELLLNFPSRPVARPARVAQWLRGSRAQRASALDRATQARMRRVEAIFAPEIANAVLELQRPNATSPTPSANSTVLVSLNSPWRDIRLEQSAIYATAFGLEYRWPLLDADLIQQYLSTPAVWKMSHGVGRYLHRSTMSDLLPKPIVDYRPKHMGRRLDLTPAARYQTAASGGKPTTASAKSIHPEARALFSTRARRHVGMLAEVGAVRAQRLSLWLGRRHVP
ncbi:MAG: hypothetical protein E6Q90_14680 [Actinobacteria bacterium]|nr:MAG: hypothetical protein E6Q90_14680 [Actinomycetota bacterium]